MEDQRKSYQTCGQIEAKDPLYLREEDKKAILDILQFLSIHNLHYPK